MTPQISQACNMLVPVSKDGKYGELWFLAVDDHKGRGIILPGGEFEGGTRRDGLGKRSGPNKNETYEGCARRECREETGHEVKSAELLFHSMNVDGWYVFTFLADRVRLRDNGEDEQHLLNPRHRTNGGKVVLAERDQLLEGFYRAYYELMFQAFDHMRTIARRFDDLEEEVADLKTDSARLKREVF